MSKFSEFSIVFPDCSSVWLRFGLAESCYRHCYIVATRSFAEISKVFEFLVIFLLIRIDRG